MKFERKMRRSGVVRVRWISLAAAILAGIFLATPISPLWAHVTLRPTQPLRPKGFANVSLVVPNERHVDTTKISLEVPQAFLKAGGRLSRVEYPPGWQVTLDKEDKPGDVYRNEIDERSKRQADAERSGKPGKTEAEKQEQTVLDELRKKWIKKVTFEGGSIPPDGFKTFLLSFELPDTAGEFRFPAVQVYSDGKEVSWSELVQGAEHPAASIVVERPGVLPSMALPILTSLLLLAVIAQFFLMARLRKKERGSERAVVGARN